MKVIELMNKNVVTCHPSEAVSIIINKFELFKITGMPVVEKGRIVGIVSQSDIIKHLRDGSVADLLVKDVMVRNVVCVTPAESAVAVAKLMVEKGVNRIPIVENDKVVGIVTRGDIIKAVAECG